MLFVLNRVHDATIASIDKACSSADLTMYVGIDRESIYRLTRLRCHVAPLTRRCFLVQRTPHVDVR